MTLDVHDNAVADLDRLWQLDGPAAATVAAILEQLEVDPHLIDKLTQHGDNVVGAAVLGVKRWKRIRSRQGDLWRFRVFDTPATVYRVVYGFHVATRQICVLGVVHKDEFDYDNPNNDFAKRICADWAAI